MSVCEEVFHTTDGIAYADLIRDRHRETWPIRTKHYLSTAGTAAGAAVMGSALDLLEARAQFDAPEQAINIRIAEHAGRLYLDLADEHWRAVAIDGWKVVGCPPVRCSFVAHPCRCRNQSGADRSKLYCRSLTFQAPTTLCWSLLGC